MNTVSSRRLGPLAGGLVGILLALPAVQAQVPCQYEVTIIQAPECAWPFGFPPTFGTGLNELGHVVGFYSHCGGEPGYEAFIWTPESGLVTLPRPPGVWSSTASDLNDADAIVGTYTVTGVGNRGYVYQDGQFTELPPVVDVPGAWSSAAAISNAGVVVGQRSIRVDAAPQNAYIWSAEQGFTDLTVLGDNSAATAINGTRVTGWRADAGQEKEGFLWDDGNLTLLGPIPEGLSSQGNAISEQGIVAGSGRIPTKGGSSTVSRGFVWEDGQFTIIEPIEGYDHSGAVGDIDSRSQVVGASIKQDNPNDWRGYLWVEGVTYDLNDLIISNANVLIEGGAAVNDSGIIVALGNNAEGDVVAFVLAPISRIGDLDGDCAVGISDLLLLLEQWGMTNSPADLNGDGTVGILDLLILLANWG